VLGRDEFADRQCFPFPDLLIADAAVPKVGGIEVLGYLRRELKLNVPGGIFSASLVVFDMRRVVELGRADYFVRPVTFSVLVEVVQSMEQSWLAA
jgi:DNA-binding response OmpR family regulator